MENHHSRWQVDLPTANSTCPWLMLCWMEGHCRCRPRRRPPTCHRVLWPSSPRYMCSGRLHQRYVSALPASLTCSFMWQLGRIADPAIAKVQSSSFSDCWLRCIQFRLSVRHGHGAACGLLAASSAVNWKGEKCISYYLLFWPLLCVCALLPDSWANLQSLLPSIHDCTCLDRVYLSQSSISIAQPFIHCVTDEQHKTFSSWIWAQPCFCFLLWTSESKSILPTAAAW